MVLIVNPTTANAQTSLAQCNGTDNVGGQAVECRYTVTNNLGGGNTSSGTGLQAGGDSGGRENAPDGGTKAAPCDGFKNQTGITDSKIVIANAADVRTTAPRLANVPAPQ